MGNLSTPEALSLRWADVSNDPALRDLPYKIELNIYGKIEMSPANNRHARLRGYLAREFARRLEGGSVLTKCSMLTNNGVKVPDVAWATTAFLDQYGDTTPFPRAPEICVEIVSPSNSDEEMQEKKRAYLSAGAREVWLISEEGSTRYYDNAGERTASSFPIELSPPAPAPKS
jgi:Uma2 family endonuclease